MLVKGGPGRASCHLLLALRPSRPGPTLRGAWLWMPNGVSTYRCGSQEFYRLDPDGKLHTLLREVHSHDVELLSGGELKWLPAFAAPERRDARGNRCVSEPDLLLRITPAASGSRSAAFPLRERSGASWCGGSSRGDVSVSVVLAALGDYAA